MVCLSALAVALLLACVCVQQVAAGGNKGNKGKGGGEEDIIMYNGNIVMRGDKQGGSIIMANQHPQNEEVEFSPQFFTGFGEMGAGYRRRR